MLGPPLEPFWAEGYGSTIRWVRCAHRLAGEDPPTIDRIAVVLARPVALAELVARAVPDVERSLSGLDPERAELLRWHCHEWLGLDHGLRRGLVEGLRSAADRPVATRVRRVGGALGPDGSIPAGNQHLQTETLFFGAWTGDGPRWGGWLIEPAAAAGLRAGHAATGTMASSLAVPDGSASPSLAAHGYTAAMRLVVDLERHADLAARAARAAAAACRRARSSRGGDPSAGESLPPRLRDVQSSLLAAAKVAGEAAAGVTVNSGAR